MEGSTGKLTVLEEGTRLENLLFVCDSLQRRKREKGRNTQINYKKRKEAVMNGVIDGKVTDKYTLLLPNKEHFISTKAIAYK